MCGGCSSRTYILSNISNKPQRVCDTCYRRLCNGLPIPATDEPTGAGSGRMVTLGSGPGGLEGAGAASSGAESSDSDEEGADEEEQGGEDGQTQEYDYEVSCSAEGMGVDIAI